MNRKGPQAEYQQFLTEGRFMMQRSRTSGRWVFYPRVAEPASGHLDLEWQPVSGEGSVHAVTVVRPRPPEGPYCVALIDLVEGPRMMSRIEGVAPEQVRIGMAVKALIVSHEEGPFVVFKPA